MNDTQLLRYSRHILLDEVGVEGQNRLLASRALIVGAGGLGSPVALYLGSAGVGSITVVDDDRVDTTNLQRQIAHTLARVGQFKVHSVQQSIAAINPDVQVLPVTSRAGAALLDELVPQADVVLDCSDNFATRHAINRACVTHRKPLVSGAAIRFDGQIASFDFRRADSPCYHCLFQEQTEGEEERCALMGVFAPLVGIIGAMQAGEELRLLTGIGEPLVGKLLLLDGLSMSWHSVKLARDKDCAVCSVRHASAKKSARSVNHAQA